MKTLYKRTSKGQIQEWQVIAKDNYYITREGVVGGKITESEPHFCEPKNIGKANETSAKEQAEKEALAAYEKKLRRGYMTSIDVIDETSFEKPMKADQWRDRKDEIVFPVLCSDKLNGVRVRINKDRAFSTGGEKFFTIPHIIDEVAQLFKKYPNLVLDGEAFNPKLKKTLNRLTHLVNVLTKEKDLTPELLEESKRIVEFHCFDAYGYENVTKDTPYKERFAALRKLLSGSWEYVRVVPVCVVKTEDELMFKFTLNRKEEGEGLMIRWGNCPYKHGRSKYMVKLKHFDDAEWEIVDLEEGNGDWAGAAKRAIMKLDKATASGQTTFASNILGSYEELAKMFKNKNKIIGQKGTVSYQQLSEYGVPQLPWLISIRNYE